MSECCMTREEANTQGMKRQAQELIEQAYQRGYKAGYSKAENDYHAKTEDDRQSSYELGMNEAWEAARKLVLMDCRECNKVLGDGVLTIDTDDEIFTRCTASEAIEKIRAYENQKKQKEKGDTEIRVGDVIRDDDVEAVVTWCDGKNWNGFLLKGEDVGVGEVGQVYSCMSCNGWKKTCRHFHEIAEVLKKLQEGKE